MAPHLLFLLTNMVSHSPSCTTESVLPRPGIASPIYVLWFSVSPSWATPPPSPSSAGPTAAMPRRPDTATANRASCWWEWKVQVACRGAIRYGARDGDEGVDTARRGKRRTGSGQVVAPVVPLRSLGCPSVCSVPAAFPILLFWLDIQEKEHGKSKAAYSRRRRFIIHGTFIYIYHPWPRRIRMHGFWSSFLFGIIYYNTITYNSKMVISSGDQDHG